MTAMRTAQRRFISARVAAPPQFTATRLVRRSASPAPDARDRRGRAAFRRARRVLLVAPMASESRRRVALIAWAVDRGHQVLFAVHRREIVMDAQRLTTLGVPCRVIMADVPRVDAGVQVASVQTVAARGDHPPRTFSCGTGRIRAAAGRIDIAAQYRRRGTSGSRPRPKRAPTARGFRDAFDELIRRRRCANSRRTATSRRTMSSHRRGDKATSRSTRAGVGATYAGDARRSRSAAPSRVKLLAATSCAGSRRDTSTARRQAATGTTLGLFAVGRVQVPRPTCSC